MTALTPVAEPGMIGHRDDECSCHPYDDGDPENGPHVAIELEETCPLHGRGTTWAAVNGIEYDRYTAEVAWERKTETSNR